jgi:hypothetical protein
MGDPNELFAVANCNEPTLPEPSPGVLSQLNYGNIHASAFADVIRRRGLFAGDGAKPFPQIQMGKKCYGLETGRQVSNLHLPNLSPGVLSQLNYIRIRFR